MTVQSQHHEVKKKALFYFISFIFRVESIWSATAGNYYDKIEKTMSTELAISEFKGTNIKTPFEVMRAGAIIHAKMDTRGLSLINFNLTTFLERGREEDSYFILSLWAVEPIKHQTQKFRLSPELGQQALVKRAENLIMHLEKRADTSEYFLNTVLARMTQHINRTLSEICPHYDIAQSA